MPGPNFNFTHLTSAQRKRTLVAFYLAIPPLFIVCKYLERKFVFDKMDSHLNKSKLFGGRTLHPDPWSGKEW